MKTITLFLTAVIMSLSVNLSASTPLETNSTMTNCTWDAWFKYPQNNGSYDQGKDVYVRVDPRKYQDIEFMELYVNGKFVRKESSYPYEWAKGSGNTDSYLRNLQPGTYKLKVRIKDKCGKYHEKYCNFQVKGGHNGGENCEWDAWFKYPRNEGSYEQGKDVYVRVDPKKYQDIEFMELYINGKLVRKESSYPYEWAKGSGNTDSYLRNLQPGTYKLKVRIKDKCGKYHEKYCNFHVMGGNNGGGNSHCEWDFWFKYPQNNGSYDRGKDVYVRVDPKKYQDIEYMELYINGKFVRKESSYPYEWAKGSGNTDSYLRNLQPGTYKLKARIKDKCGDYHEKECTFNVKGGGGHPGNGNGNADCKYKSWFKYPKNNGTYRYGEDVYVRVDTEKYQDIQEMELYVNGRFVRKESSYPYEWAKGSGNTDSYLRNLKRGTYNLKCRVRTKCGQWHEYFAKFYVR